ncbi:hypothetical protein NFI96_027215 [Prochilodus magdalenae]|nr:hypothetical protein NFI96_027215 [Prochilodus magdalenae]
MAAAHSSSGGRTGSRCSRRAVVGVGLLCVLLLIMTVVLYMYHIKHQTSITTCTAERETLLSSITNLTGERDQLKSSYQNLTGEYKILQTRYDNLLKLTKWRKNENSFYFFSTEQKTWSESRQDCRERGADLVIINSREEQVRREREREREREKERDDRFVSLLQMFLINQKKERWFWIGLTDEVTEGVWKWVDDQPLMEKEKFWISGEPDNKGNEDCARFATTADGQKTWNDAPCSDRENWVCEFNVTNFRLNTST